MKAIEGIELSELLKETEREIMAEQRRKVSGMVSGIVNDLRRFGEEKLDLEKKLTDVVNKIAKARDKYDALSRGDWSVLNENMLKGAPSAEKT